jgi:hypothetical protein
MLRPVRMSLFTIALAAIVSSVWPSSLRADEIIEKEGVAAGVSAGNIWFIPIKAISVSNGILSGALSFLLTGGNLDLTKQIWQDTTEGPYVITPELAKKGIGDRPELSEKK